ncbi:hypothetical protein [Flammeovirga kamogawensis]|uniref:Chemotaxis protein CheC n=1 Tax=Flammeovirga kamogawensis TaxID=373891 RepID=A0ABX8GQX0_9BACT|nr:hypothetical protein [Flammeovirga kamogawensis]MBB6462092.1 chemotaxis protein CheY-P-specific phosphatase CheC [Flammeovirga kamogawensis]QWG05826.1 hypothetical protein KM029_10590 [Flammeovirga kamogawensis]TRX67652.1 hypothetical protein EO216_05610 [Flammeovirga kamogawensis]
MIQSQFTVENAYLINDITNIALGNVANSLSTVLKDEIIVRNVLEVKDLNNQLLRKDYDGNVFVLTTNIIGDMKAETMLIIHNEDEQGIIEKILPRTEWGKKQMREAMLLELDNILIAAFVTKFANLFNASIYGHVPGIKEMTKADFNGYIKEREESMNVSYALKAELGAFKSRVNMELICMFDETLVPFVNNFDMEKAFVGHQEEGNKESKEDKKGFFKNIFG